MRPGLFSVRVERRRLRSGQHSHDRSAGQLRKEPAQVWKPQADAPRRRCQARCRDVDEDGATASAHARPVIVPDDDDEVVETIRAPQVLCARRIRMANAPVVVAILRVVAPPIVGVEPSHGQARLRSPQLVWAIEGLPHRKMADGRCPIPLALKRPPSRPPERTGHAQIAEGQNSSLRHRRKGPYDELLRVLWTVAMRLHWSLPAPVLMASHEQNRGTPRVHRS